MQFMQSTMERLHVSLPVFNSRWFYKLFAVTALANPVAVWTQAYKAWVAASTAGISGLTFSIMFVLQLVAAGYAIRIKDPVIFMVMCLSALASLTILSALFFR